MAKTTPFAARALGTGLSALGKTVPALAANLGERIMFRTRRRPPTRGELEVLDRAERLGVDSQHGRLAVWRWGTGPAVLLVHGWNGRAGQLTGLVEPLVAAGYQVVAFDAPGHGESPGNVSSMIHFADAIEIVLDAVRPVLGRARAVVAHSMGGPATVVAMSRSREAELPAERFVLIAPPTDVRDFVQAFASMTGMGRRAEDILRQRIERRFQVTLEELEAPGLARRFDAPALVVHDADDREVPISRGRELARAWPGATFVETRGLGHVRILSARPIIDDVVAFVEGRPQTRNSPSFPPRSRLLHAPSLVEREEKPRPLPLVGQ